MDRHVADTEFVGAIRRPVYETSQGRQYGLGDEREKVFGFWYKPREECLEAADSPRPGRSPGLYVGPRAASHSCGEGISRK